MKKKVVFMMFMSDEFTSVTHCWREYCSSRRLCEGTNVMYSTKHTETFALTYEYSYGALVSE